jgi:hypothetical protein
MPRYTNDADDLYAEQPVAKTPKAGKLPKDDVDEELEEIEKGTVRPDTLSKARRAFGGQKLSRPRFGGFGVGR